jgi:hypothetical protein
MNMLNIFRPSGMRCRSFVIIAFAVLSGCDRPVLPNHSFPVHLYIACGQSNMVGYGAFAEKRHRQGNTNIFYQFRPEPGDGDPVWSQTPRFFRHGSVFRDLGNARLRGVGPWWSFAHSMAEANETVEIRILMLAVSGSSLSQWAKDGEFYDENLRIIKQAIAGGAQLKGMIWHQGESGPGVLGADYGNMFRGFVESLRVDLGEPNLPVVAGKLAEGAPNAAEVNRALDRLAHDFPDFAVVDVPEKTLSDKVHFDTKTSEKLGNAMAEAMLRLQATSRLRRGPEMLVSHPVIDTHQFP